MGEKYREEEIDLKGDLGIPEGFFTKNPGGMNVHHRQEPFWTEDKLRPRDVFGNNTAVTHTHTHTHTHTYLTYYRPRSLDGWRLIKCKA